MKKERIDIFDFDGTLIFTPTREDAIAAGHKLSFQGWWGRKESLIEPIVSDPLVLVNLPVAKAFRRSQEDPTAVTVMMTGRQSKLRNNVLDLLERSNLLQPGADVETFFNNGNTDTLSFKMHQIHALCRKHQVSCVQIWEDRLPHAHEFASMNLPRVIVFYVGWTIETQHTVSVPWLDNPEHQLPNQ
eukprot:TRINITY_DN3394_c0_g1::TRINITY_DN3394_c0_g1_i1::g.30975::m.30975 TRINITY_DN3394_c0_g1::TRINITY_DN3394_c0_g1_i1::g.30975  ORF type:complete len:187 (+),score=-3.55,DUF2410/PF10307.4/7.7e-09 TRINITY_DN3394_c0_g1_i1:126-686(+)